MQFLKFIKPFVSFLSSFTKAHRFGSRNRKVRHRHIYVEDDTIIIPKELVQNSQSLNPSIVIRENIHSTPKSVESQYSSEALITQHDPSDQIQINNKVDVDVKDDNKIIDSKEGSHYGE